MTPRTGFRRRYGLNGEHGQMIVLFALTLIAIIAMAGLLIDGGMAWANRRQAQAAADTAALAAAKAIVASQSGPAAALAVAKLNGFGNDTTDCAGVTLPGNAGPGVQVNRPPQTGPHTTVNDPLHANDYVEVYTTRKMATTFAGAVGQSCWLVTARAVSSIGAQSVAQCSFCSLNRTDKNHTLVLKNGATLRVDGDIYVNSTNGGTTPADCDDAKDLKNFNVCGDGFDVFGDGGVITARTISVTGGWETHDQNPTQADALATLPNGTTCPLSPDPPSQLAIWKPSRVCIHMPQLPDPLNDPLKPENTVAVPPVVGAPVANVNGCVAGAGETLQIPTGTPVSLVTMNVTAVRTICPGTYYGGIKISSGGKAKMLPGVYYMAGGGFTVVGTGSVDGSAGVMIYNSSGTIAEADSNFGVDLVPAKDKAKKDAKNVSFTTNPNKNIAVGQTVQLTLEVGRNKATDPTPTGTMTFYEGDTPITGCSAMPVASSGAGLVNAVCSNSWSTFGTKAITAVYSGDAIYNAVGVNLTLTINTPPGNAIAPIDIETSGSVKLWGASNGPYQGMTLFQDRSSALTVTLNPGVSAGACSGDWLTHDVPHVVGPPEGVPPDPCGALGGLQGTIYAANEAALIYITASGLADLQVIAGKIQIDSNADTRFAFTPSKFANGGIRLVE